MLLPDWLGGHTNIFCLQDPFFQKRELTLEWYAKRLDCLWGTRICDTWKNYLWSRTNLLVLIGSGCEEFWCLLQSCVSKKEELESFNPWRAIRWSEQRRKRHEKATKRFNSCSISPILPPQSVIPDYGTFFPENDGRWPAKKRHVIRDDGLRRVIITVFTVS